MSRLLRFAGTLAVATAGFYLAYVVAWFLALESPRALLAVFAGVEWYGIRPRWAFPGLLTRFPSDGSAALYALYQGGFFLSSAVVLVVGLLALPRARGWLRLFLTQVVLWAGVLFSLYVGLFVGGIGGPLQAALRALWPAQSVSLALRVTLGALAAALVFPAAYLAVRHLLDSAAETRLPRLLALGRWLVLPAGIVSIALTTNLLRGWGAVRWGVAGAIVLLVVLVGLPAAMVRSRPAPPLRPGFAGAAALLLAFGFSLGGLLGYGDLVRLFHRADFPAQRSQYWFLHAEKCASVPGIAEADQRLRQLGTRLSLAPPNPAVLHAYFYTSVETKRVFTGSDEPYTLRPSRREVHHLLTPAGDITDPRGDALLLMRLSWGKPGSEDVARALARYALGEFHGSPLGDYAARITREEGPYRLRDIFQLESDYLSPLVRDALAGAWVESLVERRGPALLPLLYRTPLVAGEEETFARALGSSWEEMERDWGIYQLANAARLRPPPTEPPPASFFHRGISFSHEVSGEGGYGSDRAQEQLRRIHALGANSVAVVPYAFTRAPRASTISFNTDETDARVIRTLEAARQLGLHTMLKPQLWSGAGFTGDIVFPGDAEFERWFALYRRWLLHYARLAELYDVDLLVIGTELGGLTRHEAAWRALIADLRGVYSGPLTYAAHWGPEFETLPFWDALDYLGVNMYYPLAEAGELPRADSPRVAALVEKFANLSGKYNKPVLFTEVGFPASATAASEPWKEDNAPLDLELQERCYATIFEAFYAQPWFAGLYWWKWPSHGGGNRFDPSYNPIGKPAAEVLAGWYGRPRLRPEVAVPPQSRYTHLRKQGVQP